MQLNVSSTYSRADGCSGSAIKGVKSFIILSPSTTSSSSPSSRSNETHVEVGGGEDNEMRTVGSDIMIASVGYDQRLSVWKATPDLINSAQNTHNQIVLSEVDSDMRPLDNSNQSNQIDLDKLDMDGDNLDDEVEEEDEGMINFPSVAEIMQKRDGLMEWVSGAAIHIGDVCALDAVLTSKNLSVPRPQGDNKAAQSLIDDKISLSNIDIIVVGEGFQLLALKI